MMLSNSFGEKVHSPVSQILHCLHNEQQSRLMVWMRIPTVRRVDFLRLKGLQNRLDVAEQRGSIVSSMYSVQIIVIIGPSQASACIRLALAST